MAQDLPPIGGYEPIQWKRNLPSRGFRPKVYFWGIVGICAWGTWLAVEGARERVELRREIAWARIYLQPLLEAEQDRDLVRRHLSRVDKEKRLMGDEYQDTSDFYNKKRFPQPTYVPFNTGGK